MIARVCLVAALLLGASAARGDDARARARVLYDRGMAHYNVGDYAAAIDEFKHAYELTRAPGLLFNLAQACRLGKRPEEAVHFYRSYLRERPNAPNRKDALGFIGELEQPSPAPSPSPAPATEPPVEPPPAAPVAEPPAKLEAQPAPAPVRIEPPLPPPVLSPPPARPASRTPFIAAAAVVGGLGLAALGTASWFAVSANDASGNISGVSAMQGAWSGDLQRSWDDGQRDAQVATALFVVGGVATGVGVVLAVVAARKHGRQLALSPPPSGGLGWSCAF